MHHAPCTKPCRMKFNFRRLTSTVLSQFPQDFRHRRLRRSMRLLPRPTVIDAQPFHPEFHIEFLRSNCATPATRYPQKIAAPSCTPLPPQTKPLQPSGGSPPPFGRRKMHGFVAINVKHIKWSGEIDDVPCTTSSAVDGCHPSHDNRH